MAERKPQWPETGDLVIATIETVTDYGAYAKLDEFDKRGLLHVSEISSSWIRNIRDFVRENQKITLKVLRVDHEKGHIDLSLRRVTKRERIEKVMSWKKERKADALIRGVAEKTAIPLSELLATTVPVITQKYDLYEAFEKAAIEGPEVLTDLGIAEPIAQAWATVAEDRIHVKLVKVRGTLELKVPKENGVKVIKDAFHKAKPEKVKDAKLSFHVIAAPKYQIEVQAENYKRAEDVMQRTADNITNYIVKSGGEGNFRREK